MLYFNKSSKKSSFFSFFYNLLSFTVIFHTPLHIWGLYIIEINVFLKYMYIILYLLHDKINIPIFTSSLIFQLFSIFTRTVCTTLACGMLSIWNQCFMSRYHFHLTPLEQSRLNNWCLHTVAPYFSEIPCSVSVFSTVCRIRISLFLRLLQQVLPYFLRVREESRIDCFSLNMNSVSSISGTISWNCKVKGGKYSSTVQLHSFNCFCFHFVFIFRILTRIAMMSLLYRY